ncbi:50S ribosomal protein L20 [Candidatus Phytoplasma pini]|uniref:Large ribosomal subunit protein bL20 n=1 Tax=Candidatus Phytoplasma pini TaxID=267362 RepID=A0A559KJU2_9MOLU|nr:50S ribosomal protein L20 [Candidatus Phytoplasma pini]TVY12405.1 LSU ribosomal protein L20P [Candidatus Phytoplasma pini]
MVKINFVNARHKRRKKILKLAKGYFGSKSVLYKTAHEQVMRSLQYSYRDRRQRKRDFRKLWIIRINACCLEHNIKYSHFIHGLSLSKVLVNRKMLADMAMQEPEMFGHYVSLAKNNLKIQQDSILVEKENQKKEAIDIENQKYFSLEQRIKKNNEFKVEDQLIQKQEKSEDLILNKMLLSELKKLAKEYKIKNISKFKKADLIKFLEEYKRK